MASRSTANTAGAVLWGGAYLVLAIITSLLFLMLAGMSIGWTAGPATYLVAGAISEEAARLAICVMAGFTKRRYWLYAAVPVVSFEYVPILLKADWNYMTGTAVAFALKSFMSLIHVLTFVVIGWTVWRRSIGLMLAGVLFCSAVHALNNWYGANLVSMDSLDWTLFVGNVLLLTGVAGFAWRAARVQSVRKQPAELGAHGSAGP